MTRRKKPEERVKRGRPEIIVGAVLEKLEQAFLMGCPDLEACLYAGIDQGTLYDHQKRHPDFLQRKNKLKENPYLVARSTVYKNLKNPNHAEWFLERKRKDEFSLRTQMDFKDVSEKSQSDLDLLQSVISSLPPVDRAGLADKIKTDAPAPEQGPT